MGTPAVEGKAEGCLTQRRSSRGAYVPTGFVGM